MKLYGTPPTRVLKAIWLLQELDLDYELIPVDLPQGEHLSDWFLALNPAGKVPVLVDGDLVLPESTAIALYLAEKYPAKRLIPDTLEQRAHMNRWLYFLVTEVEQPLWRVAKHTFIYPETERLHGEVALARRDGQQSLSVLEGYLSGREFFLEHETVADFVAAYTLDWANEIGWLESFPVLTGYLDRMYSRSKAAPRITQAGK